MKTSPESYDRIFYYMRPKTIKPVTILTDRMLSGIGALTFGGLMNKKEIRKHISAIKRIQKMINYLMVLQGAIYLHALVKSKKFIIAISILFMCGAAHAETGVSSYYGNGEKLNRCTANGKVFDPTAMTCATYAYPFSAMLKVTNLANGKSVVVRVNDRGPNKRLGRVIDLSREAFKRIASLREGLIKVKIERGE